MVSVRLIPTRCSRRNAVTQKQKQTRKQQREATAAEKDAKKVDAEKLKASLDAIIDEIDETLTENIAAETIKGYVQSGGE